MKLGNPRSRKRVDPEKRQQRRVLIGSIIVIGLMVFSAVAYYVVYQPTSGGPRTSYGQYQFTLTQEAQGSVWTMPVNGQQVEFQNLPTDVGNLSVDPAAVVMLQNGQQIILTADTNLSVQDAETIDYARLELSLAIPKTENAMTMPDTRYTLPIVNCSVATPVDPVVYFNITNDTDVRTVGSCIILDGEQASLLQLKDRLIFEYLGILRNGQVVN